MQVHTRGGVQSALHCVRSHCLSCRHLQTYGRWQTANVHVPKVRVVGQEVATVCAAFDRTCCYILGGHKTRCPVREVSDHNFMSLGLTISGWACSWDSSKRIAHPFSRVCWRQASIRQGMRTDVSGMSSIQLHHAFLATSEQMLAPCGAGGRPSFPQSVRTLAIAAETPQIESPDPGIQTSVEKLPKGVRLMTVTVPPLLLQKIEQKELKYFRSKTEVPGFRKGKRVRRLSTGAVWRSLAPSVYWLA